MKQQQQQKKKKKYKEQVSTLTHGLDSGGVDAVTLGVKETLEEALEMPAHSLPDGLDADPLTNGLALEVRQVNVLFKRKLRDEKTEGKGKEREVEIEIEIRKQGKQTYSKLALVNIHLAIISTTAPSLGSPLLLIVKI